VCVPLDAAVTPVTVLEVNPPKFGANLGLTLVQKRICTGAIGSLYSSIALTAPPLMGNYLILTVLVLLAVLVLVLVLVVYYYVCVPTPSLHTPNKPVYTHTHTHTHTHINTYRQEGEGELLA